MGTLRPRKFVNGSRDRFGLIYGMPVGQITIRSYNILSALQSRDVRCKLWNVLGILCKVACDCESCSFVLGSNQFHSDVLVEHDS